MKRVILVVLLVAIAGVAGIVRSHSIRVCGTSKLPQISNGESAQSGETREEIRQSYDLSPGARVEVSGINGAVKVETSDSKFAEVYIERTGKSREALNRRKVTIQRSPTSLIIHGEEGDVGFFARFFGANPSERVTLRLPRQISLLTKGVNGSVIVGELEGAVEVYGVNGKVDIGQASGSAQFKGINGNISVTLKQIENEGIRIAGVNGNIELRLNEGVNADLEAHGMNGSVRSDLPEVQVQKSDHGNKYYAHIGNGGSQISVSGINGNVRLTRVMTASTGITTEFHRTGEQIKNGLQ